MSQHFTMVREENEQVYTGKNKKNNNPTSNPSQIFSNKTKTNRNKFHLLPCSEMLLIQNDTFNGDILLGYANRYKM